MNPKSPSCPACGARMKRRERRSDGAPFWGCSRYPSCRAVVNIPKGVGGGAPEGSTRKQLPWSPLQEAVFKFVLEGEGNAFVDAVAGSAKTTSLIEAMWRVREATPKARVLFVAFNKSIADELKRKTPRGVHVSTLHSYGLNSSIRKACEGGRPQIDQDKVHVLLQDLCPGDARETRELRKVAAKLVSLAKGYLADDVTRILEIADHHQIDEADENAAALALRCMERCKVVEIVDFDDMIWLPEVMGLPCETFDLVLVDEAQDLNLAQMALVRRAIGAGGRAVFVGDPRQAIYGFRGADAEAVNRIVQNFGCTVLPLSVTYRCPRRVVALAQQIVPQIRAAESAPEGVVRSHYDDRKLVEEALPGDLILCRVNAPLVSAAFAFLREGKRATIQGRDIGQGLVSLVKRLKARTVADLSGRLSDWRDREIAREEAKARPSQVVIEQIQDKVLTLSVFMEGALDVQAVISSIERLFQDNGAADGVKLSSIHRAKGLEADVTWILRPELMPHPRAEAEWEVEQERNLIYVAVTRAKRELRIVGGSL